MFAIKKRLMPIVGACLALLLTTGTAFAGGGPRATYVVNGTAQGKGTFSFEGSVNFGLGENDQFNSYFQNNLMFGCSQSYGGTKDELDLGFISFWTFEEQFIGQSATGSGIRLLFGLLIFGAINDDNGTTYSFAGVVQGRGAADQTPLFTSNTGTFSKLAARSPRRELLRR